MDLFTFITTFDVGSDSPIYRRTNRQVVRAFRRRGSTVETAGLGQGSSVLLTSRVSRTLPLTEPQFQVRWQ